MSVCLSAYSRLLRYGMRLILRHRLKHFANESTKKFYVKKLKPNFHHTYIVKPDASRGESSEYYFVARGFKGAQPGNEKSS